MSALYTVLENIAVEVVGAYKPLKCWKIDEVVRRPYIRVMCLRVASELNLRVNSATYTIFHSTPPAHSESLDGKTRCICRD